MSTKKIALIGIFTALTAVMTTVHIDIAGQSVHFGEVAMFVCILIFSPKESAFIAGVGMSLSDLFAGYAMFIPVTLVARALASYIGAKIAQNNNRKGQSISYNLLAYIVAGIISLVAYSSYSFIIYGQTWVIVYTAMVATLVTTAIGIAIALPVGYAIAKSDLGNISE